MTPTDSAAVELTGLSKSFPSRAGAVRAVKGIDLTIRRGEIVAFLGPNGAGKTTTLDLVLGLTSPTSGDVRVLGRSPREAVRAGQVSAVLQTGGLLRDLSVRETVQMIASTYAVHAPVDDVVRRAGLTPIEKRRVSKCSGGEQQRLRFALALLPDPDLLILDEPTAGMDVQSRRAFWDAMKVEADAGRTVLFATHYLEEADAFAGRIVLVADGEIVADGPTDEIRARALGRRVSARVPSERLPDAVAHLRVMAIVHDVAVEQNRLTVESSDSDAVARELLTSWGAHDLEITSGSLESAFIALTRSDTEGAVA
ncbi:ABC transporter ATP-binding protein [Knoellia sinensis KCTC 19936]|uniref:ABC transporter ATP-binding protein n=1 Tax=Knoellia sinensis KCTC 19936 TaxID=1385520 RepID=A0A0A0JG66_9MICO|nr:ABC transporter ATP-binding protein [Knoellia sinensis]KGN34586.1 ABC transporter ATP-binding protein [Knoellia sinensis KCTC 19936]